MRHLPEVPERVERPRRAVVQERRPLRPGDEIGIAGHKYTIQYEFAEGTSIDDVFAEEENIFGQSLLEKAGLAKPKKPGPDRG